MRASYRDIVEKIPEPPQWWDQGGVPRFAPFTPQLCPDIYAREVVLLAIVCQECKQHFQVEMHGDIFHTLPHPKNLHYGDPPWHTEGPQGECSAGATMNCDDLAVLQVWQRKGKTGLVWHRRPDLEGPIAQQETLFAHLPVPWEGAHPEGDTSHA